MTEKEKHAIEQILFGGYEELNEYEKAFKELIEKKLKKYLGGKFKYCKYVDSDNMYILWNCKLELNFEINKDNIHESYIKLIDDILKYIKSWAMYKVEE